MKYRPSSKTMNSGDPSMRSKSRIPLVGLEASIIADEFPSINTVTFYRGIPPINYLQDRVNNIVEHNPWLEGKIVKSSEGKFLEYYDRPVNDSFTVITDFHIDLPENYENGFFINDPRINNLRVKTGSKCVNKKYEKLFKVFVITSEPNHPQHPFYAVIFTMNHVIADGYTFYKLQHMLSTDREVQSMIVERVQHFTEKSSEQPYTVKLWMISTWLAIRIVFTVIYNLFCHGKYMLQSHLVSEKYLEHIKYQYKDYEVPQTISAATTPPTITITTPSPTSSSSSSWCCFHGSSLFPYCTQSSSLTSSSSATTYIAVSTNSSSPSPSSTPSSSSSSSSLSSSVLSTIPSVHKPLVKSLSSSAASCKTALTAATMTMTDDDENSSFTSIDTPMTTIDFVSTNDILTSMFFKSLNVDMGFMCINYRNRFPEVTDMHAGNYETLLVHHKIDFENPAMIRRSLLALTDTTLEPTTDSVRDITTWRVLFYNFGFLTNWSTFYHDVLLPESTQLLHMPLFKEGDLNGALNGANGVIFKTNKNTVMMWTHVDHPVSFECSQEEYNATAMSFPQTYHY